MLSIGRRFAMADYRSMFDRDYIGAWDLGGADVTVTIAKVEAKELRAGGSKATKKPVVYFASADKGFALNKTNAKVIAGLYGPDTAAWIGKRITIYPTQTSFGGDTVDCIRVRNKVPADAA
jgi:hypothetical protein